MRQIVIRAALATLAVSWVAFAQGNNPIIILNENGAGTIQFPGAGAIPLPGVLAPDPGPGGLAAAMTFNLLGPPSLVAGDVILSETGDGTSDILRFNPAGTVAGYAASVLLYSDKSDGVDSLADTGFPTAMYTNIVNLAEVGPEGNNGIVYTPTANQPGFVAGFSVTYDVRSDSAVPEPGTASLMTAAGALLFLVARRPWKRS